MYPFTTRAVWINPPAARATALGVEIIPTPESNEVTIGDPGPTVKADPELERLASPNPTSAAVRMAAAQ